MPIMNVNSSGVNLPSDPERKPSTLANVALALSIAKDVVGTGLDVYKTTLQKRNVETEENVSAAKIMGETSPATADEEKQGLAFKVKIGKKDYGLRKYRPDSLAAERQRKSDLITPEQQSYWQEKYPNRPLPANVGVFEEAEQSSLQGSETASRQKDLKQTPAYGEVERLDMERRRLKIAEQNMEISKKRAAIALKQGGITADGLISQIEEIEKTYEKSLKDPMFRSNFIPIAGQLRKIGANTFKLDDPESAGFFAMMDGLILDYTKSKQGSRPSDLDLNVIRNQIFPSRGDFPDVARRKFKGVRRMLEMLAKQTDYIPGKPETDRSAIIDSIAGSLQGEESDDSGPNEGVL